MQMMTITTLDKTQRKNSRTIKNKLIVNDSFYSYGTRTVSYFIKNIPCRQEQERIEFDVTNYDAMIRGTSTGPTTIGRMRKMTCTVAHQYGRWHLTLDVDV